MGLVYTVGTSPVSLAAEARRSALVVTNRGQQSASFKIGDAGGTLDVNNGVYLLQPGGTLTIDTARAARMQLQGIALTGTTTLAVQEIF